MTREEMILFILANPYVHITHFMFQSDEYIYSKPDGNIYDENGYLFEDWDYSSVAHDGIRIRNNFVWEDGWRVIKESKEVSDGKIKQIPYGHLPLFYRV